MKTSSIKDAVASASHFVEDLYPQARDIRLEEIQPDETSKWKVVLSFQIGESSSLASVIGNSNRLFKSVEVDRDTSEPLSLAIWKF